jgi:hypothetical protein
VSLKTIANFDAVSAEVVEQKKYYLNKVSGFKQGTIYVIGPGKYSVIQGAQVTTHVEDAFQFSPGVYGAVQCKASNISIHQGVMYLNRPCELEIVDNV